MILTLDSKRRFTVPTSLMAVRPGDRFEVRAEPEDDTLIVRRLPGASKWLEIMRQCPVDLGKLPPRRKEFARKRKL